MREKLPFKPRMTDMYQVQCAELFGGQFYWGAQIKSVSNAIHMRNKIQSCSAYQNTEAGSRRRRVYPCVIHLPVLREAVKGQWKGEGRVPHF